MITRSRTTSLALALGLGLGAIPALMPSAAAAEPAAPLRCLPANWTLDFLTLRPLAPGLTSQLLFRLPGPDHFLPPEQRKVTRPDGSQAHEFTVTFSDTTGVPVWVGLDTRTYSLPDLGTWIMHDSAGQPWRQFTAKAASWFASFKGPGRIVTAGDSFTVTARLAGWAANGTQAPVRGMPVTVRAALPSGRID